VDQADGAAAVGEIDAAVARSPKSQRNGEAGGRAGSIEQVRRTAAGHRLHRRARRVLSGDEAADPMPAGVGEEEARTVPEGAPLRAQQGGRAGAVLVAFGSST